MLSSRRRGISGWIPQTQEAQKDTTTAKYMVRRDGEYHFQMSGRFPTQEMVKATGSVQVDR